MQILTFEDLDHGADAFDATVDQAPLSDRFCTGADWVLPARRAFASDAEPVILRLDDGWAPWMCMRTVLGRTWMPLEASWGLAAPLVGADLARVAAGAVEVILEEEPRWDALFLSGLTQGDPAYRVLVKQLGRRFRLGIGQSTVRCVASLEGGLDGFLARRSAKFRKNLRHAEREADGRFTFEAQQPVDADDVIATIVGVEKRSWKGHEGHGIDRGPMNAFYTTMVPRLAANGRLRVTYARHEGEAVGYVLGGVRGDVYRGLQISYDAAFDEHSLGNLMQLHTVGALCEEGVTRYDLGTDMDYKRRWAEERVETVPLVVR